ncbi:hypothetical protein N7G274_006496 [Stereocaulon virgatum]|uniref:C4-dicarboxylate transporter/malic acid transport protein n=1 Tax=Stereocaulon virgatum TaxID=373712 RepID=A0ABR4A803_9LECA
MDSSSLEGQHRISPERHNRESNGTENCRQKDETSRISVWRNIIQNFTPAWFTIGMNTGVLAIVMHQLPYQFKGLPVLTTIMYILDLVLFIICSIITILRWTMYPKVVIRKTAGNLDEIALYGAPPIAFLTLTALTGLIVSKAEWGGHAWSLVAYVMWWFGMAFMLTTCMTIFITLFRTDVTDDRGMSAALTLPIVGVATAAVAGALICNFSYDISPRLAVPVIIVGYFLVGWAVWLAIVLYGVYFQRLLAVGWPEPAKRPHMMMLVGPFGQSAAAIQLLGSAAKTKMDFAGYNKGTFLTAAAAPSANVASVVFALLLLGSDLFWITVALIGILEGAYERKMSYSLVWWTTIFPVSTMTTAFISLSIAMDSPTFRVLSTALLLILLVDFFINWGYTIWYSIKGDLLIKHEELERPNEKIA